MCREATYQIPVVTEGHCVNGFTRLQQAVRAVRIPKLIYRVHLLAVKEDERLNGICKTQTALTRRCQQFKRHPVN